MTRGQHGTSLTDISPPFSFLETHLFFSLWPQNLSEKISSRKIYDFLSKKHINRPYLNLTRIYARLKATKENSEWLGQRGLHGIEPSTSRISFLRAEPLNRCWSFKILVQSHWVPKLQRLFERYSPSHHTLFFYFIFFPVTRIL